jgi:hypothetical protein
MAKIGRNLLNAIPNDKMGSFVKWGMMGALGFYLLRMKKKEGNTGDYKVDVDTDKMVDTINRYVKVDNAKASLAKEVLREFRRGYARGHRK